MEKLIIPPSENTPFISFNPEQGAFTISGKSLPENVADFYQPVLNYLTQYAASPNPNTTIVFEMIYMNTATAKIFYKIFTLIQHIFDAGNDIEIMWKYNEFDESIQEAGEDLATLFSFPVKTMIV